MSSGPKTIIIKYFQISCLHDFLPAELLQDELKSKWEVDKAILEESTSIADKKYNEINEQVICSQSSIFLFVNDLSFV